ncbi:MAG: hypothetical protein U1C59_04320, partial [Methylotenera sp.]|nr:hypothetical protein [Methylotenera sp.]
MANIGAALDTLIDSRDVIGSGNLANDVVAAAEEIKSNGATSSEAINAYLSLANGLLTEFTEGSAAGNALAIRAAAILFQTRVIQFSTEQTFPSFTNVIQSFGGLVEAIGIGIQVGIANKQLGLRVEVAGLAISAYGGVLARAYQFGENLDLYGWWQSVTQTDAKREAEIYAIGLAASLDSSVTSASLAPFEATTKVFIDGSKNSDFGIGESVEYIKNIRKLLGLGAEFTAATANDVYAAVQETRVAIQALYGDSQFQISDISNPRNDLSAFLSLYYVIPFSVKPGDAGAMDKLYQLNATIADKWNADRNLTPEQIANGEANFSDKWLADRTAMVAVLLKANLDDIDYANAASNPFIDYAQNIQINPGALHNSPNVIFGSINNENIAGGLKN